MQQKEGLKNRDERWREKRWERYCRMKGTAKKGRIIEKTQEETEERGGN